jgi:hypothetical protein
MTTVNKYRIKISPNDRYINIPIQIDTDLLGRDDLVDKFEEETLEKVINPIEDFELTRFTHKDWYKDNILQTSINHKFSFFDRSIDVGATNPSNVNLWTSDYVFTDNPNFTGTCFTEGEIYYNANSYKNSFFKLDLYDTDNSETQKLYLTIILPTQQGLTRLSGTEPPISNPYVSGPTIPDILPGGGDFGLAAPLYYVPTPTPTPSTSKINDVILFFPDTYETTFLNCNSISLTKYIDVQIVNELLAWPQNNYTIDYQGTCFEIISIGDDIIPDAPPNDIIDDFSDFTLGNCDCINPSMTPTPSISSTPTPTPTPPSPTPSASFQPPGSGGEINNNAGNLPPNTASTAVAPSDSQIKMPNFLLDYVGDKEGYFIYWLKNPNYIDIDKFYMSAKFFNAKTGQFVRMMNTRQSALSQKFNFESSKYFYYQVNIDYENYEYDVINMNTQNRVGTVTPINWYEYVNPS